MDVKIRDSTKFAIVKTFFIIRYNEECFKGTMEKVEKKENHRYFNFISYELHVQFVKMLHC